MNTNKVVVIGSCFDRVVLLPFMCFLIFVILLDLKTEIAEKARERILKSRPPLLFENKKIEHLKTGNIAYDLII